MTTMLKEIEKWKPKIEVLRDLDKKNDDVEQEVSKAKTKIKGLYFQLFKKLTSKRIKTDVVLDEEEKSCRGNQKVCLNIDGLSLIGKYETNSNYLHDFSQLQRIAKIYPKLLKFVKKKEKKKLLKNFFKIVASMGDLKLEYSKIFDEAIEITDTSGNVLKVKKISYDGRSLNFYKNLDKYEKYNELGFQVSYIHIADYVVIEQVYPLLIKVMEEYSKKAIKINKTIHKTREMIRETFSAELIAFELLKDERGYNN